MKITKVTGHHVRVPVRMIEDGGIAPYAGSQDKEGVSTAQALLIRIETDAGIVGWGEMNTGFPLAVDVSFVDDWIAPAITGSDPTRIRRTMARLDAPYWPQFGRLALACAVEMALWDITARSMDRPISSLLGGTIQDAVPVAFCVGITTSPVAADIARRALDGGWRVLKTKIGLDLDADLDRIQAIVDATSGQLRLRLDANQGYDRTRALAMLRELQAFPVEYVEQPLPIADYAGTRSLAERSLVPIAINEDAYTRGGIARGIAEHAIDAVVVDIEGVAGLNGLIEAAAMGSAFSIPMAHHCGWDLGVKSAMMLQAVSALPGLSLASDSTYAMHLDDVLTDRLITRDGAMVVPTGPGIGAEVDEKAVRRLSI